MLRTHDIRKMLAGALVALTCAFGAVSPGVARAEGHHVTVTNDSDLLPRLQVANVARTRLYRHLTRREWAGAAAAMMLQRRGQGSAEHRAARVTPVASKRTGAPASGAWSALAQCESSGNWSDTDGMYEGGLQFDNGTWLAYGGGQYAQHAYDATPGQQIAIAEKVLARQGPGAWPVCSYRAGLR